MKILIAGSTGLVGEALVAYLTSQGHTIKRLVRHDPSPNDIPWNPEEGLLDPSDLENSDALINLSGENISSGRWTADKKRRILASRVQSTQTLCRALSEINSPPGVFINTSATGYYGDRGDVEVTESSPRGTGFLADVCDQWEAAVAELDRPDIRKVRLRLGVVLSPKGGALGKMLGPFKFGLGGVIGSGNQYISWIGIDDLVKVFEYALNTASLQGAVNAVTPTPVTNREFTKALGKVLHRPTFFAMPKFLAQLAFGEMANETILCSTRVAPKKLLDSGFAFSYPELEGCLSHEL